MYILQLEDRKKELNELGNRIENFSKSDGQEAYQVEKAKIAIATGGILGKGPGKSIQKNFLPQSVL